MTIKRIRAALTRAADRRLAATQFCDGCGQVCDATCRSAAHRRHAQATLAQYAPLR